MHEGYPCITVLTQACCRCITSEQVSAYHQCTSSVHISAPRPLSRPVSHRGSLLARKQVAAGRRRAGRDKGRGTSSSYLSIFASAQDIKVNLPPILWSFLSIIHAPAKSLVLTCQKNIAAFQFEKLCGKTRWRLSFWQNETVLYWNVRVVSYSCAVFCANMIFVFGHFKPAIPYICHRRHRPCNPRRQVQTIQKFLGNIEVR